MKAVKPHFSAAGSRGAVVPGRTRNPVPEPELDADVGVGVGLNAFMGCRRRWVTLAFMGRKKPRMRFTGELIKNGPVLIGSIELGGRRGKVRALMCPWWHDGENPCRR